MSTQHNATVARAVAYSGANGNVVVENKSLAVSGFVLNGGAAGATFRVFDNATTNTGTVLFAATLAANTAATYFLSFPILAFNGVTINASAAGGAGSVMTAPAYGGVSAKSISGATATNVVASAVGGVTISGLTINASNTGGASTVSLFDNATTSTGTPIWSTTIPTQAAATTLVITFPNPIKVANGITASVATTAVGDITLWVD
jgi:hypothetical protein